MNPNTNNKQIEKATRLIEYLIKLASLRTTLIRNVSDYEKILWINEIPREKGCFTQAWGRNDDYDTDIWIEVQNRREPELPLIPEKCKDWIDKNTLRKKNDIPELRTSILKLVKNPDWIDGTDLPELIHVSQALADHPEIQKMWDRYIEDRWLSWTDDHNSWETVHKVYSLLFSIYQEQLRLGEEYELVLAFGLLTWHLPKGLRVHRHIIVANSLLEFDARLSKFTVRPSPDGANLRVELDMLDLENQPPNAEEIVVSYLSGNADDPWEKEGIEGTLKSLVHSIHSQGHYEDTLGSRNTPASEKPTVEYAPALILRKRSIKGLTDCLRQIKERINQGESIPTEFADITEISQNVNGDRGESQESSNSPFPNEVFFPKPANDEQRRIVTKINSANGVLVQGPPGTGKSHTIANLICHLLASGQRILITAKTPRALQVLKDLVPEELQPLCVNLLGSGIDEKRALESSIGGILRKSEYWDDRHASAELNNIEMKLSHLREEKARIDRRIRDIRESETYSRSVAEGIYHGTAAQIARIVRNKESDFEWFKDSVPLEGVCPLSANELRSMVQALRQFTAEKRRELNYSISENLPSSSEFLELINHEKGLAIEEKHLAPEADEKITKQIIEIDKAAVNKIMISFSALQDKLMHLSAFPHAWLKEAIKDIIGGAPHFWKELCRNSLNLIDGIESIIEIADNTDIQIAVRINNRALLEDALILHEHLLKGGRLGCGPFRPKVIKDRKYLLKSIRINGHLCTSIKEINILIDLMRVRIAFDKIGQFWKGRYEKNSASFSMQFKTVMALCGALNEALILEKMLENCRCILQQASIKEPNWSDSIQIDKFIASCKLALVRQDVYDLEMQIQKIEYKIAELNSAGNAHPAMNKFLEALRDRDFGSYAEAYSKVESLKRDKMSLFNMEAYFDCISQWSPMLRQDLESSFNEAYWDARIEQIQDAWHWAQARGYIEDYLKKEDAGSLVMRSKQIEDEINSNIALKASLLAWGFCLSRLNENHRRHMGLWQQSIKHLGKGTGKHAPRYRKEAQENLNECREAVSAWVMPLHRIWDTIKPLPGMFDLIIVDEASQCGFEALPLLYLGKKILIVGDDKQISPDEGFIDKNIIFQLMEKYLYDFEFKGSFQPAVSLFAHGKIRYSAHRVALQEHFRCMPEIIRFSNGLCYSDTPLIPLRQYGPDRLEPLQHVFVDSGYREGSDNRVINRQESDAIAYKIAELCHNPKYKNKTMGVIVLQGDAQGALIEARLLDLIGATEIEKRRLICGNPYSFQGDQRDIIFLSMVAAPNERIGAFVKLADERRFNVAASRARDQMWLFHSVRQADLSESCLRRKLLAFFENKEITQNNKPNKQELERRAIQDNRLIVSPPAPFDSWFEVDVCLELLRKGFDVIPQYEVAGKRIDLIIEGGKARLAIECYGDKWHGLDQYEQDSQRQRMLERCGWEFYIIRECEFYADSEVALRRLWPLLEERGIFPNWQAKSLALSTKMAKDEYDLESDDGEQTDIGELSSFSSNADKSGRRLDGISSDEISNAIVRVLEKCPNYSCTLHSMTSRVLRELGVITRGKPRLEFEKRVMRSLTLLENKEQVERYRAKNRRVRLLRIL